MYGGVSGACVPMFDCGNPVTSFPCATRSQLDTGEDVALLAAPDGKHVAAARGFRSIAGVECSGDYAADGQVGTLAAITVAGAPATPVLTSNVTWPSVTFSNDSQYLVYVDGVTDLCSHSGTLRVAKADGSAPATIATGQYGGKFGYGGTFLLVGDYVVYAVPASDSNPCSLAAVPLAGGTTLTIPLADCDTTGVLPDPAGSAFLIGQGNGSPVGVAAPPATSFTSAATGGISLVRLAAGTIDTLATDWGEGTVQGAHFAWSPDGSAVAITGFSDNGDGPPLVTVATVSGATPDVTTNCQCNATPVFSPDSTKVAWDVVANSGDTIASAAVIQTVGGSATTIGGLPGSGVTQLGFTADNKSVFAVDSNLLLLSSIGSTSTFATVVQDVGAGFTFAPSSDHVAVVIPASGYGGVDVYPLAGGAPVLVAGPAGPMTTSLLVTQFSASVIYEPVSDHPALLLSGETNGTAVNFAELVSTDGSKALLEGNMGLVSAASVAPSWFGRVMLFETSSTGVNNPAGGLMPDSIDIGAVADDGSSGGTLARSVTALAAGGQQLFYLRGDQPGVWMVPVPQPAN
jgi:hypothetical protein